MSQPAPQPADTQPPTADPSVSGQVPATPEAPAAPAPEGFALPQAPVVPAPAARPGNLGLGLAAAAVAALVTAVVYGVIIGKTGYQVGYAAVGVGLLIGLAAGRLGGAANPVAPVVGALLALGAVYAGQLLGVTMLVADELHTTASEAFSTIGFGHLNEAWKESLGGMDLLFFALGAYTAFRTAQKSAR
ncbi:hypothetical protein [Streptomyces sp. NRRL S-87]|uniref:hypothetical protein n=1 Tax=Streptomyces sp. NRRL S-87 TaxID=1463920 RepID=UPI0004C0D208|nr:hypothetical protein [Streptomyces sp. NRRL S-87]